MDACKKSAKCPLINIIVSYVVGTFIPRVLNVLESTKIDLIWDVILHRPITSHAGVWVGFFSTSNCFSGNATDIFEEALWKTDCIVAGLKQKDFPNKGRPEVYSTDADNLVIGDNDNFMDLFRLHRIWTIFRLIGSH
jgi:hypothetical protein